MEALHVCQRVKFFQYKYKTNNFFSPNKTRNKKKFWYKGAGIRWREKKNVYHFFVLVLYCCAVDVSTTKTSNLIYDRTSS